MNTLGLRVLCAISIGVASTLALSTVHAAADTCTEQGGTAECVAPQKGPYTYQIANSFLNAVVGSEEAPIIAAFTEQVRNHYNACTLNVADNRPPWQLPPAGTGSLTTGNYTDALFYGIGQYFGTSWMLSTEVGTTSIPLVYTGTFPKTGFSGTPACSCNLGAFGAYVSRWRDIACPGPTSNPFRPNDVTPPLGAYCCDANHLMRARMMA